MITKNDVTAAEQSVPAKLNNMQSARPGAVREHSRRYGLWRLGTAALAAVFALGLIGPGAVRGLQVNALQIIPLAQGFSPENNLNLHVEGPSDVLQSLLVFQPGGDTGWHTHPGPVVVVVKTGALTEYHSNGCVTVHPAGSVFFETKEEVHRAVNQTGGVAEVYATFISPTGAQPLIPASDPGAVCRK
jgi:quercetin dioxygenase-like cupin family protein